MPLELCCMLENKFVHPCRLNDPKTIKNDDHYQNQNCLDF